MARDPVCGMDVDEKTAQFTSEHGGVKYYFCCGGCKRAFEKDPAQFVKGAKGEPAGR